MQIELKGFDEFSRSLRRVTTQVDYALTLTINDLVFDSQKALNADIKHNLNTRVNTSKAYAVDKAKKTNLTGIVRMKSDWHKVALMHHYTGGSAVPIMFEKAMIDRGYMNANNSAIPLKKMGKAKYKTILNSTNRGVRSKHFVVPVGNRDRRTAHLEPGIYQRLKRKVKPVIIFTSEAQYKKRMDMREIVEKVVSRRASSYFNKNMARALRTAR